MGECAENVKKDRVSQLGKREGAPRRARRASPWGARAEGPESDEELSLSLGEGRGRGRDLCERAREQAPGRASYTSQKKALWKEKVRRRDWRGSSRPKVYSPPTSEKKKRDAYKKGLREETDYYQNDLGDSIRRKGDHQNQALLSPWRISKGKSSFQRIGKRIISRSRH